MKTKMQCLFMAQAFFAHATLNLQLSTGIAHGQNLIVNGDFSAGNTGFTSGYTFSPSGQSAVADTYGIRTSSTDFNSGYNYFGDHTTGSGNMMLVDGSTTGSAVVWQETVSVAPNTIYAFSGWATASDNENVPTLRFYINGVQAGSDFTLSTSPGLWQQFDAVWNSGAGGTATIALVDLTTPSLGNDFALDDFSFAPLGVALTSTAFTYQGWLYNGNSAANGSYDMAFTLFATNTSGVAIAGPVTNTAVAVTNGLFTTQLDFGNAFSGANTWLEIAVSPNGANTFTTLTPRQQITPTPYALFAATAANAVTAVTANTAVDLSGTGGNSTIASPGSLNFGAQVRQMINLFDADYGIGVQTSTLYFRTHGGPVNGFGWYAGGVHSDTRGDSGGGATLMFLDNTGLTVGGTVTATNFVGNGAGLTGLNPANLGAGTAGINITGTANSANTATSFSGSLSGDVTGTQGATVVNQVGGQTAANVAGAVGAVNSSTSANTPATLVQRDGSGNFSAGTITANLTGTATTAMTANNFSGSVLDSQLSANVPMLNGTNVFTGTNNFAGVVIATNVNNQFTGNGAGLTNVPASAISGGINTNVLIGGHTFYITNGIIMNIQ